MTPTIFNYLTVPGGPSLIKSAGTARVFFVDSNGGGSTTSGGLTPESAFTTIDSAIGACTASKGDIIYVMPGHAETLTAAAGIDADVAGISIIGLGNGSNTPTITLGTVVGTDVDIDADNITIKNLRFVSDINDLTTFIDCNSNYFTIEDCDFVTSSAKEAICFIDMATTKDYLTVRRCRFEQPTDPAGTDGGAGTGAIYLVDSEYILVEDCWFQGNFETAIIHNKTTKCRYLWVKNCHGIQALSGAEPFQLVADVDGGVYGGMFITPAETAVTEATLVGTIGDKFFVSPTTGFGNDGAAGGQGAVIVATAS
jgi:pectin methylesterase-like acyl-CoA thioesterase